MAFSRSNIGSGSFRFSLQRRRHDGPHQKNKMKDQENDQYFVDATGKRKRFRHAHVRTTDPGEGDKGISDNTQPDQHAITQATGAPGGPDGREPDGDDEGGNLWRPPAQPLAAILRAQENSRDQSCQHESEGNPVESRDRRRNRLLTRKRQPPESPTGRVKNSEAAGP